MASRNLSQSNTRNCGFGVQFGKNSTERSRTKSENPIQKWHSQGSYAVSIQSISTLLCIILLLSLFILSSSDQAAAKSDVSTTPVLKAQSHQEIGPVSDSLDDIIALLLEIIRILEEALRKIEAGPDGKYDPLVFPQPISVLLDGTQDLIDQMFNPLQDPNLSPVDAGTSEHLFPRTLTEFADTSLTLADEALAAAQTLNQPLRDETIGSKLKTIEELLPLFLQVALDAGFD